MALIDLSRRNSLYEWSSVDNFAGMNRVTGQFKQVRNKKAFHELGDL
jgi:hypothetical protein